MIWNENKMKPLSLTTVLVSEEFEGTHFINHQSRHFPSKMGRPVKFLKNCKGGSMERFSLKRGELRLIYKFSWETGWCWDHFWWGLFCLPWCRKDKLIWLWCTKGFEHWHNHQTSAPCWPLWITHQAGSPMLPSMSFCLSSCMSVCMLPLEAYQTKLI